VEQAGRELGGGGVVGGMADGEGGVRIGLVWRP